jgi:hypothetical protein
VKIGEIKAGTLLINWQSFPFSFAIPDKAEPSFCFGHDNFIMKVRHRLIVLFELKDDTL